MNFFQNKQKLNKIHQNHVGSCSTDPTINKNVWKHSGSELFSFSSPSLLSWYLNPTRVGGYCNSGKINQDGFGIFYFVRLNTHSEVVYDDKTTVSVNEVRWMWRVWHSGCFWLKTKGFTL